MLRCGHGIGTGGIHHEDTADTGGRNVYIVHARSCPADRLESRGMIEHLRRDFGSASNHHGLIIGKLRRNLFHAPLIRGIYLYALRSQQQVQAGFMEPVTYKNSHIQSLAL